MSARLLTRRLNSPVPHCGRMHRAQGEDGLPLTATPRRACRSITTTVPGGDGPNLLGAGAPELPARRGTPLRVGLRELAMGTAISRLFPAIFGNRAISMSQRAVWDMTLASTARFRCSSFIDVLEDFTFYGDRRDCEFNPAYLVFVGVRRLGEADNPGPRGCAGSQYSAEDILGTAAPTQAAARPDLGEQDIHLAHGLVAARAAWRSWAECLRARSRAVRVDQADIFVHQGVDNAARLAFSSSVRLARLRARWQRGLGGDHDELDDDHGRPRRPGRGKRRGEDDVLRIRPEDSDRIAGVKRRLRAVGDAVRNVFLGSRPYGDAQGAHIRLKRSLQHAADAILEARASEGSGAPGAAMPSDPPSSSSSHAHTAVDSCPTPAPQGRPPPPRTWTTASAEVSSLAQNLLRRGGKRGRRGGSRPQDIEIF